MKEITVKAEVANVEEVTAFVDEFLESIDCPMKVQMQLDIVIDEIFSNIANYAYEGGNGDANVKIDCIEPGIVVISFEDSGIPYNPLAKEDPDVTLSAEEREIGGLGVFMVKKMTDNVEYAYENGKNILIIKKNL